jgi:hypothetical protein
LGSLGMGHWTGLGRVPAARDLRKLAGGEHGRASGLAFFG